MVILLLFSLFVVGVHYKFAYYFSRFVCSFLSLSSFPLSPSLSRPLFFSFWHVLFELPGVCLFFCLYLKFINVSMWKIRAHLLLEISFLLLGLCFFFLFIYRTWLKKKSLWENRKKAHLIETTDFYLSILYATEEIDFYSESLCNSVQLIRFRTLYSIP